MSSMQHCFQTGPWKQSGQQYYKGFVVDWLALLLRIAEVQFIAALSLQIALEVQH
jgi:hypothetical protein